MHRHRPYCFHGNIYFEMTVLFLSKESDISQLVLNYRTDLHFSYLRPVKNPYARHPHISPADPADIRRMPADKYVQIRAIRGDTPRPAPEGASGTPHRIRFLPSFCPCGTWRSRGCVVLPSFIPLRGNPAIRNQREPFRPPPTNS